MVGGIDPGKSLRIIIALPKRGLGQIEFVQVLNKLLRAAMIWSGIEKPPFKLRVRVPFVALAEFTPHEEKDLPGKKPLIAEQGAEIGEAPPIIARHAAQKRP